MENKNVNKVPPAVVRERLSRDVNSILKVCIRQFDEVHRTSKEQCFDVDAVIQGRSVAEPIYGARVRPAAYTRVALPRTAQATTLSRPQKGYFIPQVARSVFA